MKSLGYLYWFFTTTKGIFTALILCGAGFMLTGLLLPGEGFPQALLLCGAGLLLGLPLCIAATVGIPTVLSNRQLMLVPGFRSRLWLCMLVLSVVLSIICGWALPEIHNGFPAGYGNVIAAFNLITLLLGFLMLAQKWPAVLFLIPLFQFSPLHIPNEALTGFPGALWILYVLSLGLWLFALQRLRTQRIFTKPKLFNLHQVAVTNRDSMSSAAIAEMDEARGKKPWFKYQHFVFLDPIESATRLPARPFMLGFIFCCMNPLIIATVFRLMGLFMVPDEVGGVFSVPFYALYLFLSLFIPSFLSVLFSTQIIGRQRQTWLRREGNRSHYWQRLEKELATVMAGFIPSIALNALLVALLTDLAAYAPVLYFIVCIEFLLIFMYSGIARGAQKPSGLSTLILFNICLTFMLSLGMAFFIRGLLPALLICALLLALVFATRWWARRQQLGADWTVATPFKARGRSLVAERVDKLELKKLKKAG